MVKYNACAQSSLQLLPFKKSCISEDHLSLKKPTACISACEHDHGLVENAEEPCKRLPEELHVSNTCRLSQLQLKPELAANHPLEPSGSSQWSQRRIVESSSPVAKRQKVEGFYALPQQ